MISKIIKELKRDYDIREHSFEWGIQVWEGYIGGKNQFDIEYSWDYGEMMLHIKSLNDTEGTFWLGPPSENTVKEIKKIVEKYKTD